MNADTAVNSYHVDEVVEAEEGAHDLLVVLHDDVNAGPDGLIHQLWKNQFKKVISIVSNYSVNANGRWLGSFCQMKMAVAEPDN